MSAGRLILFAMLVLAAWLALFGDKTPSEHDLAEVVAPAAGRDRQAVIDGVLSGQTTSNREVAALIPRRQLIPADDRQDGRHLRDLFPSLSWTASSPMPEGSANPPPPMAPPLAFVYLGKKLEAGQWEVYLGRGDEVFIVREGMSLDGSYRVKSIAPPTLTLIYLPLKQLQTIPIGGSP